MKHGAYVSSVDEGSIAKELEIARGDLIVSIDGQKIIDYLDYKFLASNEHIFMEVLKTDGELIEFEIYNEDLEDLGINFETMLFDSPKAAKTNVFSALSIKCPKGCEIRSTLKTTIRGFRFSMETM